MPNLLLANKLLSIDLKSSVEVGRLTAESIDDVRFSVELFVNHKSQNSHHGGTSVVQFNGTLLQLFLGGCLPFDNSVSEITSVFTGTSVLHDEQLKETNEGEDLDKSGVGDIFESSNSGFDGGERCSLVVNVSGDTGTEGGVDVSENGKHGNTSVLDFDVTKTIESFLVNTVQHVQRIPVL